MKTAFSDPQSALYALGRLEALTGITIPEELFEEAASPDLALQNLERWLQATSSPSFQLQQLFDDAELGRLLVLVLGGSPLSLIGPSSLACLPLT